MKKKKRGNAKEYIILFCASIMTVTLSSAVVINSRNRNLKCTSKNISYVKYSFDNSYTYDELPKYMTALNDITINKKNKSVALVEEEQTIEEETKVETNEKIDNTKQEEQVKNTVEEKTEVVEPAIVYDNMTIEQLTEKINKSLNSTVAGKGDIFASYSLEKGVDPYIATAIMLHETGCKWTCSSLVRNNNNVGGVRLSSGYYKSYETIDDGIKGYIDNLSSGYFSIGLNTVESIARKYTGNEGTNWIYNVNNYIESIKAQ